MVLSKNKRRIKKKVRVSKKISGTSERPRLVVFRSINNISGQIIDDTKGHTITAVSSIDKGFEKGKNKTVASESAGSILAKKALEKGVKNIVFDRNGYLYHGRIKAFADGARKGGLIF